jgi:hypothetical protein
LFDSLVSFVSFDRLQRAANRVVVPHRRDRPFAAAASGDRVGAAISGI